MRKLKFLILTTIWLYVSGCSNHSNYDKWYDRTWESVDKISCFMNEEERNDYQAGLADVLTYNDGYSDAIYKLKPQDPENPLYMEGYEDGKKTSDY